MLQLILEAVPCLADTSLKYALKIITNNNDLKRQQLAKNELIVTINLKALTGIVLPSMQQYILILTLTGIDDI